MRIYEDKDDIKLVQQVASASTLISSVTGATKDLIIKKFPKNFFRSIYIDTEEASTSYFKNKKYNDTVNKIPYPSISVSPEISLDDPIGGMTKSIELSSTNLFLNKDLSRSYKPILRDPDYKFSSYFSSDYITVNFNFKITLKKYIENIDLAYYIKSAFQFEFFQFYNNVILETEFPKSFVRTIAAYKKLNLADRNDMERLEEFLASASVQDKIIRKKKNLSTGKDCFFFGRKENLLIYFADLDCPPAIIRNQQADDEYVVTFRIQVSAWLPNSFILSMNKKVFESIEITESNDEDDISSGFYSTYLSVPLELKRKRDIYFINSSNEKCIAHELMHEFLTFRIDEKKENEFSFAPLLANDARKVHNYLVEKNIEISDVFRIEVLTKNDPLNSDIEINYEELSVKINSQITDDILVILYVDRTAFESILQAIEKDKFFFNENILCYMYINLGGQPVNVKVMSFENENEYFSSDIMKSLRIKTVYGIGYISLKDEEKNTDSYKICLGYDKNNNPIIKSFK